MTIKPTHVGADLNPICFDGVLPELTEFGFEFGISETRTQIRRVHIKLKSIFISMHLLVK